MSKASEAAVFGGGCFWCTEAVFKMLDGVESVMPGYAGGHKENPTYHEVSTGTTGHAEVVQIQYDPSKVSFRDLLTVFFATHDPTTLNRQGNDVGEQYRSTVLYTSDEQKNEVQQFINELNQASNEGGDIVTTIEPLTTFYPAEDYHHNYYAQNKTAPYCQVIINPKLEKVQKKFAAMLKK